MKKMFFAALVLIALNQTEAAVSAGIWNYVGVGKKITMVRINPGALFFWLENESVVFQVNWNDPRNKEILSTLLAAKAAQRPVDVYVNSISGGFAISSGVTMY